jgi:NDP-sugar pyrophosphorylase family protein
MPETRIGPGARILKSIVAEDVVVGRTPSSSLPDGSADKNKGITVVGDGVHLAARPLFCRKQLDGICRR